MAKSKIANMAPLFFATCGVGGVTQYVTANSAGQVITISDSPNDQSCNRSEAAEWAQLEQEALSSPELRDVFSHLRASGQATR